MVKKLENRIALITGPARKTGIGFAIAHKFASEGAKVILADIVPSVNERSSELQNSGATAEAYVVDLTKLDQIQEMVSDIIEKYGRIDILCNNAGKSVPPRPPFLEMSEEYFDTVMDRNLRTTFLSCKGVAPQMVKQRYGKIINLSSLTGTRVVYRYCAAYAAAKGGVSALTRALALELGQYNINVNAILPGQIDVDETPWSPENDKFQFNKTPEKLKWPIHRPGFPHEIAKLACFLASDDCTWITGEEIVIDGGSSILEPATTSDELFGKPPK